MRIRPRRLSSMSGFALLELAVATALAGMLVIWGASRVMHEVEDAPTLATGSWLIDIRQAVAGMLATHFDDLSRGVSPLAHAGGKRYADPAAPTVPELIAEGLLPAGFSRRSPLGPEALVRIVRSDDCPQASCRLDAVAYLQQPVLQRDSNEADFARVGGLLMAMQGHGVAVYASEPAWMRGSSVRFANPLQGAAQALPAGTVGVWAGYDRFSFDRYVRMNDVRDPMLAGNLTLAGAFSAQTAKVVGPLQVGTDISASRELIVGGGVHASTRVDAGSDIAAGGNLTVSRDAAVGGSLTVGGGLIAAGQAHVASDLSVAGHISTAGVLASGRVSTAEYLLVQGRAKAGAVCSENGLIGRTSSGMLLSCDAGSWRSFSAFGGAFAQAINDRGCNRRSFIDPKPYSTPNPVTGDCTCPAGFQAIHTGNIETGRDPFESDRSSDVKTFVCVQGAGQSAF